MMPVLQRSLRACVVFVVLVLFPLFACNEAAVPDDAIPGIYKLNAGSARDVIELQADGKHVHTHESSIGELSSRDTGSWRIDTTVGKSVLLKNFRAWPLPEENPRYLDEKQSPVVGWFILSVLDAGGGTPQLVVDEDRGIAYTRQRTTIRW